MDAMRFNEAEALEPTYLEKSFGEYLKVPVFAFDDSEMMSRGGCIWTPTQLHPYGLIYTAACDLYVYKDSDSHEVSRIAQKGKIVVSLHGVKLVDDVYMLDIKGGGSVPLEFLKPSAEAELNMNPDLVVIDLDVPKRHRNIRRRIQMEDDVDDQVNRSDGMRFEDVCLIDAFRDHGQNSLYMSRTILDFT